MEETKVKAKKILSEGEKSTEGKAMEIPAEDLKKKEGRSLSDGRYKYWDIVIKSLTALFTVATILTAVLTYLSNQKAEIRQKEREYRKEMSLRQITYYSEISQSIGELLTVISQRGKLFSAEYYQKKNAFESYYFGKMNLIESTSVDEKLQKFSGMLESFEADAGPSIYDLRKAAYEINAAFRQSIQQTFDVKLDSLYKKD